MMQLARRSNLPNQTKTTYGHHAGLILTRYLKRAVQKGAEKEKQELFAAAKKALGDKALKSMYARAIKRWESSLPVKPSDRRILKFKCVSPLIIGLGGENVTETGLKLHHTYGVPYLPGSALKGVAARYARQVWGTSDRSWNPKTTPLDRPNHFRTVFGTTDEGGLIDFLDGWITDTSLKNCLVDDVMTPHHSAYYMADDDNVCEPTDFDSPIPVPFLAVRGAFHIAICKRDPRLPDQWLDTSQQLLILALAEFGIGGKTNAGYGRLIADAPSTALHDETLSVEVELEVLEVDPSGHLGVMTLDASFAGTIANADQVPLELCIEGARLIGRMSPDGDPNDVRFEFVRPAT